MVLEFWWFLRELGRVAKVDRGKEHSLLMHQCTTEVLCNLAGLIYGLAFTLPHFSSNQYDQPFKQSRCFLCIILRTLILCVFKREVILVWDICSFWVFFMDINSKNWNSAPSSKDDNHLPVLLLKQRIVLFLMFFIEETLFLSSSRSRHVVLNG